MAYILFDDMQRLLLDHIRQGGAPLDYPEACREAMARGLVHEGQPSFRREELLRRLTDAEFEALLHRYPMGVIGADPVWPQGASLSSEIFALQHLHNPGSVGHAPKRFRIFYAYKGAFDMLFEKKPIPCGPALLSSSPPAAIPPPTPRRTALCCSSASASPPLKRCSTASPTAPTSSRPSCARCSMAGAT